MKKVSVLIISFVFFFNFLSAQDRALIAEGASPDLYISHTVSAKENFYSIGRLYNVSPKEIAPYNNLALEKGLSLGQVIKVPLNQNNFLQSDAADQNTMIPVYHVIEPKEGLYHVSTTYNKISTDLLKKWNNLQTDAVGNGTKLVVGYLNVQKGQSSLPVAVTNNNNTAKINPVAEEVKSPATVTELPNVKEEENKSMFSEVKNEEVIKNDDSLVREEVKKKNEDVVVNRSAIDFKGGTFKTMYDEQVSKKIENKEIGISGVFKSTSGWQDGKYYCFHNIAPPGTIMKITSISTGKSVYAKVLDLIPDIKQNEGLVLHISNSAAEELSVGETKFNCSLSYAK